MIVRAKRVPIDELEQECSWGAGAESNCVTLEALQLEGASLASGALTANTPDSPDVTVAPPLTVYWTTKVRVPPLTRFIQKMLLQTLKIIKSIVLFVLNGL